MDDHNPQSFTSFSQYGLFTAARHWPEPQRLNTDTPERPSTASGSWIGLYCGPGGVTAAVVVVMIVC